MGTASEAGRAVLAVRRNSMLAGQTDNGGAEGQSPVAIFNRVRRIFAVQRGGKVLFVAQWEQDLLRILRVGQGSAAVPRSGI